MKKLFKILFVSLVLSVGLSSCQLIESQHNHKYSKTWTITETEHWRVASCEHTDLIVNKGEHTFDDGVITKFSTEDEEGIKTFTCTVCKTTREEPVERKEHVHTFDTETWEYNEHYHWHPATCRHQFESSELSKHSFNRNDCWDCGYLAESQGLAFAKLSDGTYEVTSRYACTDSSVVIPATYEGVPVTSIGENAFAGEGRGTTVVVIPSSVKYIKAGAFSYAEGLEKVIFKGESSLVSIGDYAFRDCNTALTNITIPKSVTSIGEGVFFGCTKLEAITVESGNSSYKSLDGHLYSFDTTKLLQFAPASLMTEYTVPDEVESLGIGAFSFARNLKKITFSTNSTITKIPADTFNFSNQIDEIALPPRVTSIGDNAFFRCVKLVTLNIPENITTIGSSAFEHCDILPDFELPASIKNIGARAFAYCKEFTKFDFPPLVSHLSDEILIGCGKLKTVTITSSVKTYGINMFLGNKSLEFITVDPENTVLQSIGGHLYTKNGGTFLYYCAANPETDFALSEGVTKINPSAFYACHNLVNVTLPSTLKEIGKEAFMQSSKLETINLPEGVTTIGAAAFQECKNLKEITLPSTITTISENMIFGCNSLKEIVIPANIVEIHRNAFSFIPLESVTFENTAGWTTYMTGDKGTYAEPISSVDLEDNETAIQYLTGKYKGHTWKWVQPTE